MTERIMMQDIHTKEPNNYSSVWPNMLFTSLLRKIRVWPNIIFEKILINKGTCLLCTKTKYKELFKK